MQKNTTQLVTSFIETIANMPKRSQIITGLIVYPNATPVTDLQELKRYAGKNATIKVVDFTNLADLKKCIADRITNQTLQAPSPVLCLINENDYSGHSFDALSPLVFRLDQSIKGI